MQKRNVIWRAPPEGNDYLSCSNLNFQGVVIPTESDLNVPMVPMSFQYAPGCYGNKPVYSANKKFAIDALPMIKNDWEAFITHRTRSEFIYSIYPTIYSLTAATVITCFLTVLVFTSTQRPSLFLMAGSFLSAVNLLNILASSLRLLNNGVALGKASGEQLLDELQLNLSFLIIDLFSVFILQLCQVQIIMRLFSRQKEKRFTFIIGVSLSIISQVIWAVSTFNQYRTFANVNYNPDDDTLSIMPAFIYLLRIAMSVIFSVLICVYCFIKHQFILKKNLILISIVSILSTNIQVGFFIADVANVWVAELSEIFNAAGYVISTVIVWEWINQVHASERVKQDKGILGRPFYEEEHDKENKVDRISLFVPEEQKLGHDDGQGSDNDSEGENDHGNVAETPTRSKFSEKIQTFVGNQQRRGEGLVGNTIPLAIGKATNSLLYMTDQIIAYSLAVPRSVSVNSRERKERKLRKLREHELTKMRKTLNMSDSLDSDDNGDDNNPIFVYSTAEVKLDKVLLNVENGEALTTVTPAEAEGEDQMRHYYEDLGESEEGPQIVEELEREL